MSVQVRDLYETIGTMTTEIQPTRLEDYIKELLPGAHGHQIKAIATFVATIIAKQTGCQAERARAHRATRKPLSNAYRACCIMNGSVQKTSPNGSADRHLNNCHAVGKCV